MIIYTAQIAALLLASILIGYCFVVLILQLYVQRTIVQLECDHARLLDTHDSIWDSLHNCMPRLELSKSSQGSVPLPSDSRDGRSINDELNITKQQPGKPDDLKKISGIGKIIEKTLNELGIYQFSQIADFSQSDIDSVNSYLRFKGRVQRENWISQAQDLCERNKFNPTDRNAT